MARDKVPYPAKLPKVTRDYGAEKRQDKEEAPPKNRAILENPRRI